MAPTQTRQATQTASRLPDELQTHWEAARKDMPSDHPMPNLAALLIAIRKSRGGLSQMGLGTNRNKEGKKLVADAQTPADLATGSKGKTKAGFFSLIANIEQGGRRGSVSDEFVAYLAKFGVAQARIKEFIAEDDKVREAQAKANVPAQSGSATPATTRS